MLYDIEFVIPISLKEKYRKRVDNFKRLGLLNIQDKKVLLSLLIGSEDPHDFQSEWPPNIDVQFVSSQSNQETAKTYQYFATYNTVSARWIAKFDDDSINDVSNLVDKLDLEYDHERDYYIVTEFRPEQHPQEEKILYKLGYQRWFNEKNVIWHELEGSIISQASMQRILANPIAIQLMQERSKIHEGFNDYCLACAARICKIFPSDAYFMSRNPQIGDFSLFGGYLCHIHDIADDKNPHALDLFHRMMRKDMGSNTQIYNEIVNQEFIYRTKQSTSIIRLNENGTISGERNNLRIWHIKPNETIEFLKSDGGLLAVFDNYDNSNIISGYFPSPLALDDKPLLRKLA